MTLVALGLIGLNMNEDESKYMQIKRNGIKDIRHLIIDNFIVENVENFNYLVSILNADNEMNVEIVEKISKDNKLCCANSKLMKSKLLNKKLKWKYIKRR
jgi:uncharacterized protein involved in tellurium resistance